MTQSFTDKILDRYIDENMENSKKINYDELTENHGLFTAFYDELPDIEINGYPVASDFVAPDGTAYPVDVFATLSEEEKKKCRLRFYYLPYAHEMYIGTTGTGKTTGCVEPQLRAISSQKNKPNIFITDPKGELFDHHAAHLTKQGYRLFVLNFKDLVRSDKWNPLLELYDLKMKTVDMEKNCLVRNGKVSPDLILMSPESEFDGNDYIEYEGMAFPNGKLCEEYIRSQKDFLDANIDSLISQFAHMMIIVQSKNDKSWEYGAQELLKGLLHAMLEDSVDPKSGFTRDMMTFRTMEMYYQALRSRVLGKDSIKLENHPLIKEKSWKVKKLLSTALDNAPVTMHGYCGTFESAVKDWFQGHIFALTTGNTVDISNSDGKPFAIFLITRDYEKSDFQIAGLFVDWVYRQMIQRAETTKNTRPMHFLLDEFGNIPRIKDFENKISTSRSRNVWFHIVLQSYSQLTNVYDTETVAISEIIKDNCAQIFLGSTNSKTKETFSAACGKHYVPTSESYLKPENNTIWEVPLVPVSALNLIKPGKMYIARYQMPVISSQYIRSYVCAYQGTFEDYLAADGLKKYVPLHFESYTANKYTYKKLL